MKPVFLDGYKAVAAHVEKATGVSYTNEAIRKIVERDPVLQKERTWFNGIPRIKESAVNDWIKRVSGKPRGKVAG